MASPDIRALPVDAARFEVVKNALLSAAEEMKIVLAKTAYSPLLKMAGDYSCGIFDVRGNMVAQGPDLPVHLGSMPDSVRSVVAAFPEPDAGDVYIHNDPYHGGSHLPDVNVVVPAFHDGRLLGYGCVRAHWPDVGSATPGSYGAVTEIYGEGLRMPPTRIYVGGVPDPNVENLIFANVRAPAERIGDLRAQVAANRRAVLRLQGLAAKYGTGELLRIMDSILDYSEAMMRAALRRIPDGTSVLVDTIDGDGIVEPGDTEDKVFRVKVAITKAGDGIVVDFDGSDGRVSGPMNAPLTVTRSGVYAALKNILDPGSLIPPNSGAWRPVDVRAPEGCCVNAAEPAAVTYANHEMSVRVADMIFAAMHHLAPETTLAGSHGTGGVAIFGGTDYRTGETFISYEVTKGGFGARPIKDGINGVSTPTGNMMNTPVEILEMSFPLRVEEYRLVADTGGAGKWRGGLAAKRTWRILERDVQCATCCDRTITAPYGLAGGQPGSIGLLHLEMPDGTMKRLQGKGAFLAPAGSKLHFQLPGAGGYGEARERDPALIERDLAAGYVTPEAAARDYGYVAPPSRPLAAE
ncbi:hydantoinase B/oxoprolinase family protein [Methylobacterium terricola]|uniref:Hydantoinase B/oxoprolinase family protein n=1 Tax=Methylobacterium terricola TaxID=2583531 RepID=A0A5C4L8S2_9HYPH|nr:hydantoinase B/oxoprolinase family protein [Methylobacterium terricola]TNC07300.1 hydantoinase B/oxoprolinase family protein [Methylobacterium terricola]